MSLLRPIIAALLFCQALAAAPVEVSFPWARPWPVVTPATADTFGITVRNTSGLEQRFELGATLIATTSGKEKQLRQSVTLSPGQELTLPLPLGSEPFDSWLLAYELKPQQTTNATAQRGKVRFGYLDPTGTDGSAPAFMFGMVAHTTREPSAQVRQQELQAAAFAGARVMRNNPTWTRLQPSPETWDWALMDEITDNTLALGMEPQVLLGYTPRWAAPEHTRNANNVREWNRAAPDSDAWRTYVATLADRYKGRIRLWEPWNEPDLEGFWRGTTEEFITLATIAIEELRKADPANKVLSGGFATLTDHGGRSRNPDLQEQSMQALGTQFDYHAVHEHGPFERFARLVDGPYARMRAELPEPVPPLFFNETAITSMGTDGTEQAELVLKKAGFAQARGAAGYLWYDLRNDGTNDGNPEHHYGLLTHALEPKPGYLAFNTYARYIAPATFVNELDLGVGRWFFVFSHAEDKLLLYWNDNPGTQFEQVLIDVPGATAVELIDINGNRQPLRITNGQVMVAASRQPHILRAQGATGIATAGKLASPSRAFFGAPGEAVTVDCIFLNPTREPVTVKVNWQTPSTIRPLSERQQTLTIPAGATAASSLQVQLPDDANYRHGATGRLRVSYDFEGTPYKGRMIVPIHYGTIAVPANAADKTREPDIDLHRAEQLHSFIEADPNLLAERWQGPDDLSVKAWLSADEQSLILDLDVTDDVHHQPFSAESIWRGDSVQCLLLIPETNRMFELGFAADNDGSPVTMVWGAPDNIDRRELAGQIRVSFERTGQTSRYRALLPREPLGLTDAVLEQGFRFNIAVNDNDGSVRAHALQLAPGLVSGKTAEQSPYVIFRK